MEVKRRNLNQPRYDCLRAKVSAALESDEFLKRIQRIFTEDDIYFVTSRGLSSYNLIPERWYWSKEDFVEFLQKSGGWNAAAKARVRMAYKFSLNFLDMPFIVAYRFTGWIRSLQSQKRTQDRQNYRMASVLNTGSSFAEDDVLAKHHDAEMKAWKERCEWVGWARYCFETVQKANAVRYHRQQAASPDTNHEQADFDVVPQTPPPDWDEEQLDFGDKG